MKILNLLLILILGAGTAYAATTTDADFTISVAPQYQIVTGGASTTYTASLTSLGGFSSSVNLGCSGLPYASTCSFSPASVVPTGSSVLTVQTSTVTSSGTYTLTATGSGGGKTHSTTFTLVTNGISGCNDRWDENHDGTANVLDLIIIGQHFGEQLSMPYPNYDVNQDGTVNVLDLIIVGQHFGQQSCW